MALRRLADRLAPFSVPVLVFGFVATVLLVVSPLVAGSMGPGRAYLIAAALLVLAIGYAGPYAAVVAVATLPLLWAGSPGYASPESVTAADGPTTVQAIQHVVGGGYALASAGLGGVLVGAELAGLPLPSGVVVPTGAIVGGLDRQCVRRVPTVALSDARGGIDPRDGRVGRTARAPAGGGVLAVRRSTGRAVGVEVPADHPRGSRSGPEYSPPTTSR